MERGKIKDNIKGAATECQVKKVLNELMHGIHKICLCHGVVFVNLLESKAKKLGYT